MMFDFQAGLGRCDPGSKLDAPPPATAAAALSGSPSGLDTGAGSAEVFGDVTKGAPAAEAPESGFSSIRIKYW